jgi:heterodisulfide reductase subunit A-like polyferredoxin
MKRSILTTSCSGLLSVALASSTTDQFDTQYYASNNVITRDVAVIGGGATGTYGAINLRALGKSVILIEKAASLGGHTNTYVDPATGLAVNYGVQALYNST